MYVNALKYLSELPFQRLSFQTFWFNGRLLTALKFRLTMPPYGQWYTNYAPPPYSGPFLDGQILN
jgi:hypothetical protein